MRSIKKEANIREHKQAEALGMKRNLMSGALLGHKGDIVDELVLIDSKFTYNKSQITIKRKDIEKLDIEAFDYNPPRIPVIMMSIDGLERMIISVDDFKNYIRLLKGEMDADNKAKN
jgi:hypothetical protein